MLHSGGASHGRHGWAAKLDRGRAFNARSIDGVCRVVFRCFLVFEHRRAGGRDSKQSIFAEFHDVDGHLVVNDVWETRGHFDRFVEARLQKAMGDAIGDRARPPEIMERELHTFYARD